MSALFKSPLRILPQNRGLFRLCPAAAGRLSFSAVPGGGGPFFVHYPHMLRNGAGMGTVSPWTIPYRERLGIGKAPLFHIPSAPSRPPKSGQLKISFESVIPGEPHFLIDEKKREIDMETGDSGVANLVAVARDSSGEVVATLEGEMRAKGKWQSEVYSVKAAAHLAKKLREKGKHVGPVVYETKQTMLGIWFGGIPVFGDHDPEDCLRECLPDDLDDVSSCCMIMSPHEVQDTFKAMLEQERIAAAKRYVSAGVKDGDGVQDPTEAVRGFICSVMNKKTGWISNWDRDDSHPVLY